MRTVLLSSLLFVVAGCSGGATLTLEAALQGGAKSLQTPSEYQVVVTRAEMLRGADDADPGVIFDAQGDPTAVGLVDLTLESQTVWSGDIPPRYYGTYTHARVTLAAVGQVVALADELGAPAQKGYVEFYQDVDNTGGLYDFLGAELIERGEVLVAEGGVFQWFEVDANKVYTPSPDPQAVTGYRDANPGGPTVLVEIDRPITVEEGGHSVLKASFDIQDTFEWLDRDSDGVFEPVGDDHDGTLNGFEFQVGVPGLLMELVQGI